MTETIHIFDEFPQSPDELSTEDRHKKRMTLDPMIYDILKSKYMPKFQEFWNNHTVPKETDSYIVLVERRIHPNIEFVLKNAVYFGKTWGIIIVCSDININYLKEICGQNAPNIHFLCLFHGNPEPQIGKGEYNSILKNADFYRSLPGAHHIFIQVDTYFRKPIPEVWKDYDHVAAPYEWDETAVGGGLSYRKKQAMIAICESQSDNFIDEDAYICQGTKALGMKLPPFEVGITYVAESCIYEDPIAVHQWWTFFFPNQMDDAEYIFHSLLSLETN